MNMIAKIKNNPEKIIFGLWRGLLNWMNDEQYIKLTYYIAFKRKLNLDNPQSFTEKINWYKLNWRDPLAKKCADKYKVREYVRKVVGEKYLNDMFGVWNTVDEIDFSSLPSKVCTQTDKWKRRCSYL